MNKSITLVSVADTKLNSTIKALEVSSSKIKVNKVILITSKEVDERYLFSKLEIIKVKPIKSFDEYNNFITYDLYKYISTSHLILIQWDGYIINSEKWNNNFLNYDYIGPPFIPRSKDSKYSRTAKGEFYCIGNGGFSLRSLNLLKAPTKYKLKDNISLTNNHEDGFFCILHRKFLEDKGYRWAPYNLAIEFAIESPICFKDCIDLPFGFHGKKMLAILKITYFFRIIFFNFRK